MIHVCLCGDYIHNGFKDRVFRLIWIDNKVASSERFTRNQNKLYKPSKIKIKLHYDEIRETCLGHHMVLNTSCSEAKIYKGRPLEFKRTTIGSENTVVSKTVVNFICRDINNN